MVVDDSAIVRGLIVQTLERDPALRVVARAANGEAALIELARTAVDVVVLDIEMPVMDGLTAISAIRRREAREGRRTPIYTLTANAMPEHAEASTRAGADGHVTKPITAERLLHVVEQVWAEKAARAAQGSDVVALRA